MRTGRDAITLNKSDALRFATHLGFEMRSCQPPDDAVVGYFETFCFLGIISHTNPPYTARVIISSHYG
jgi:hypothetical protein